MGGKSGRRTARTGLPAPLAQPEGKPSEVSLPRSLSSGRTLRLTPATNTDNERLQVVSPAGDVEVEIVITADGPVVRVRGADLRLSSTRSIDLESAGPVRIRGSELRVRTEKSVHLNGETILLNCDENAPPPAASPRALPPPAADHSGCRGHDHPTDPKN